MDVITVDKAALLEVMRKNRDEHHDIVLEAQQGFREKVIKRLDEMLAIAATGKPLDLAIGLAMPEDHTDEYDTVIGMLEMDTEDTVELNQHEYQMWVQDKWGWQRSFTTSNSLYSAKAASKGGH